jgi:hypothetical protein
MTIQIGWADPEKTILRMDFIKNWTWDDYQEAGVRGKALTEDIPYKFTIVMDFTDSGPMPQHAFTHFKRGLNNQHPNRRMVLVISKHRMLAESMISVLLKLYPKAAKIHFARSFEEAQKFIADTVAKEKTVTPNE